MLRTPQSEGHKKAISLRQKYLPEVQREHTEAWVRAIEYAKRNRELNQHLTTRDAVVATGSGHMVPQMAIPKQLAIHFDSVWPMGEWQHDRNIRKRIWNEFPELRCYPKFIDVKSKR